MIDRRAALTALLGTASALPLLGCASLAKTATGASSTLLAASVATPAAQSNLWAIIKGVGETAIEVLDVTNPPLALIITTAMSAADLIVANLPQIEAAGGETAALVAQLATHSNTVLAAAAPSITVIPNRT